MMSQSPKDHEHDESRLDASMLTYLDRRGCTDFSSICDRFELHETRRLVASIARLERQGLIRYDARRSGYCTSETRWPT